MVFRLLETTNKKSKLKNVRTNYQNEPMSNSTVSLITSDLEYSPFLFHSLWSLLFYSFPYTDGDCWENIMGNKLGVYKICGKNTQAGFCTSTKTSSAWWFKTGMSLSCNIIT